ncbi:hypothetical protein HPB50_000164 [Hyalomma asiaticum]|uniref:Uncharacterized protein n=1 Tax=Hyalomma asiaticum TaxID=266040 RepID=A0ACB7T8I0_HYAAI|nr:hypothetical protein HPB50_000164 [Hyalomma asiaticum]
MVCSSFFLSMLVVFMSTVMGRKDVPCFIFYRMHGVLATVGFILSDLTYISQENHPGATMTGLFAAALCVQNSLTSFADTVIAYERPVDSPLGVESK